MPNHIVIVLERRYCEVIEYVATKHYVVSTYGDCIVRAYKNEREFRKHFPMAPLFDVLGKATWDEPII